MPRLFWLLVLFGVVGEGGTISVFPSVLPEPASDLRVEWKGPALETGDTIALRCGPERGWLFVQNASQQSVWVFPDLVSMRCTYTAHLVAANGTIIASSVGVDMHDSFDTPKQGHLQIGGVFPGGEELWIVFTSNTSVVPELEWTLDHVTTRRHGSSSTYSASSMCGKAAGTLGQRFFRDPGFISKVSFGVPAERFRGKCVRYRFGQNGKWESGTYCDDSETTRFLAFADVGAWTDDADPRTVISRMLDDVEANPHAFVLLSGDVSYAEGKGFRWDQFGTMMQDLSLVSPLIVTVGNHEYDYEGNCTNDPSGLKNGSFAPSWGNYGSDSGGEAAVPLVARFLAPQSDGSNGIFWFAFDRGLVRIIALSAEHDFTTGSPQLQWLIGILKMERRRTMYNVVTLHRPMYTRGGGEADERDIAISLKLREYLEPHFVAGKVDVVIVGHAHIYERTCPVLDGKCVSSGGAVHFTVGSGGAGCGPPCPPVIGYPKNDDAWSMAYSEGFGYLRFHATASNMTVQFVESTTGSILDETVIQRKE